MDNKYNITLSKSKCKSCYKCIRSCPVKAISLKENKRQISSNRCIACGRCLMVCPQKHKHLDKDVISAMPLITKDKKLIASIDPTFAAYFGEEHTKIVAALKRLGFYHVEETAVALDILHQQYVELFNKNQQKYYISSTCSAVNLLVQKYYPELNQYMIPCLPAMMLHGRVLKKKYALDSKVIFFGPCIAAKIESNEFFHESKDIDYVLTFEELQQWLDYENIILKDLEEIPFDNEGSKYGKVFPVLKEETNKSLPHNKDCIQVNGFKNTKEVLEAIRAEELDDAFVKINFCLNGCVNGPAFYNSDRNLFSRKKAIIQYGEKGKDKEEHYINISINDYTRNFSNKKVSNLQPMEEEIKKILKEMGKLKENDELNCGSCGYDTCRDKAIAIYNNMDKTDMCLPYIRNKSETISNLIFENSPNYIFLVNRDLKILSINPAAMAHLNVEKQKNNDLSLVGLLDYIDYMKVFDKRKSMCGKKVKLQDGNLTVIQNLLYIKEQDTILAILNDISNEEQRERELMNVRQNTAEMVQKVIRKQMMVAQEICSVLGETTAETKVALNKFLDLTLEKTGDK